MKFLFFIFFSVFLIFLISLCLWLWLCSLRLNFFFWAVWFIGFGKLAVLFCICVMVWLILFLSWLCYVFRIWWKCVSWVLFIYFLFGFFWYGFILVMVRIFRDDVLWFCFFCMLFFFNMYYWFLCLGEKWGCYK